MSALSFSCFGCDAETPSSLRLQRTGLAGPWAAPPAPGGPIGAVADAFGVDGGDLESKTDPPPPAGDLASEMSAFTTIDACIDSRSKIDPLLGDALDAIGYETFLSDACRMLDAAKSRNAERCSAIDASVLRERCVVTVAEVASQPDTCPWEIAGRPKEGRDPACLAIALRDGRLCAGASHARERVTCEAVAAHDPGACVKLAGRATQGQCLRTAARWATTVAAPREAPLPFASGGTLSFSQSSSDGAALPRTTVDLGPDVQRGIVLIQSKGGIRFVIGQVEEDGADAIAPSPYRGASLALAVFAPAGRGEPILEHAELRVPGHAPLEAEGAHSKLSAKLEKLEPVRGGALELRVEGEIQDSASSWYVHVDLRAFVRDTVRSVEALPPGSDRSERSNQE